MDTSRYDPTMESVAYRQAKADKSILSNDRSEECCGMLW